MAWMVTDNDIIDDLLKNQLSPQDISAIKKLIDKQIPLIVPWFKVFILRNNFVWVSNEDTLRILTKLWKMVNKLKRYKAL